MLDHLLPEQVFVKTAKGQEEIARRAHGLGPRHRQILILVDGKRDLRVLAGMFAQGELHGVVSHLLQHGYIAAPAAGGDAPAPAQAATPDPEGLREAKDFMIAVARSCLGLLAADLVARIQRAEKPSQLSSAAGYWMTALRESKYGSQACEQYLARLREVMPELRVQ